MSSPDIILHAFADEAAPARALAAALGIELALINLHTFPDGELLPTIPKTAPTTIVYRSLAHPNEKLITLLLAADAWRRAGARRLVLAAPYLCYMRQDTIFAVGQPNSQKVISGLLGDRFDRIVTVDAHLHRTRSIADVFRGIEAQDLCAAKPIAAWLQWTHPRLDFVVGPDIESENWVSQVAASLGIGYRLMTKERRSDSEVRITLENSDELAGRAVALVDDVCSSGGTLIKAAEMMHAASVRKLVACVTHALFDAAIGRRLREAGIVEIASTDSVIHPSNAIALAPLLADSLRAEVRQ